MKNILLIIVVLLGFQSKARAQEKASRFRLELSNQGTFIQGNYLPTSVTDGLLIVEKTYNSASHLSGFWRLGSRLELGIGLGYLNLDVYSLRGRCNGVLCERPNWIKEVRYTRVRALEIPLELRWKYLKSAKRLIPYLSIGIANRIPLFYPLSGIAKPNSLPGSSLMLGGTLGAGVQFNFIEKWSLIFTTQIRKDRNFKFEEKRYENKWFNEAAIKIGIGRSF